MLNGRWPAIVLVGGGTVVIAVLIGAGLSVMGDPATPIAATKVNGDPALVTPLCDGESITWIEVRDTRSQDGDGPTVWRIEARRPSSRHVFVLGDTPADFDEVVPLTSLPDRELTAVARTSDGIELIGAVDFATVKDGTLYEDMRPKTERELDGARSC